MDTFTVAHHADGKREVHTVGEGQVFNMKTGQVEDDAQ